MALFLLICLGGALGSGARYLVSSWAAQRYGAQFPRGTVLVNVTGCFLIALLAEASLRPGLLSETARLTLTTGLMGGYTTYSSFNHETVGLLSRRALDLAAVYLGLTIFGGLAAGVAGTLVARALTGR